MSNLVNYILLFLFTFITTSIFTWALVHSLTSFGIVDVPGQRRAHNKITPRGGGLAIMLVMIIGLISYEYFVTNSLVFSSRLLPLLSIISVISFLDDLITIPIYVRLITHLTCSTIIVLSLSPALLFHNIVPFYVDFIISVLALTTFLNIYNFLDGIDGISCTESIHLSITILILCYLKTEIIINVNSLVVLNIMILASSISFLLFNWHPAKIFLGDIGSIGLGFTIGLCLLTLSVSNSNLFIASFIASLYYIADGLITILIRIVNKEKIWQPHLKHFFQQAVKKGMSHQEIVVKIALCNTSLMLLSVLSLYYPIRSIIMALFIVTTILIHFAK